MSDKPFTDEFWQSVPDTNTLAWWRKQFQECLKGYRGATHGINRCLSDYADTSETVSKLIQRVETLEAERNELRASLGEMAERLDRMAEFLNTLKKNGN